MSITKRIQCFTNDPLHRFGEHVKCTELIGFERYWTMNEMSKLYPELIELDENTLCQRL
jgi:hypothetical protein